ncbi:MAG: outer membrane protein assembly factor [Bacteroidales bacterium]|nr:outer membrane protein assembly factor [Bacteroidales bacterium]
MNIVRGVSGQSAFLFSLREGGRKFFFSGIRGGVCLLPVLLLLGACQPTRYVPKGEYLLYSSDITTDNKHVDKGQLSSFVRQKPNKTILGFRFHLWLYNRSNPDKDNKWNAWLRKNGEEPVIWQQLLTDRSSEQLLLDLRNKGYYYAQVTDTVIFRKKKASVLYRVKTGWPYVVRRISYAIPDSAVARLVLQDTVNTLLRRGMNLDAEILENERKRVERNLKENGYFGFLKDNISFSADTSFRTGSVAIEMYIRPYTEQTADNRLIEIPYPQYRIRSMTVNAGLNMQNLTEENATVISDTISRGFIQFIIPPRFPVKGTTIAQSLYFFPGMLYKLSHENQTYQRLQALRNFNRINIEYTKAPDQQGVAMRDLDCRINLLPFAKHYYTAEPEVTNTDGNIGGGANLQYQNKSLFGHAEILDLRLRGMIEAVSATEAAFKFKTAMEYEAEASIHLPKFLFSFRSAGFTRRYNPKTAFSLLYNYQRRPQYTRSIFNTSIGYSWKGSNIISHSVRPIDINFVQLKNVNELYNTYLEKYPYLKNSYQTHMVVSSNYSFIRDIQKIKKDDFLFIRTNFETAGLLINTFFQLKNKGKPSTAPNKILNNTYAQFVKGDVDLRYYHTINSNNRIVSRLFAGAGLPYGNSKKTADDGTTLASMPFEKKYYSGGTLSMRGWRMRSLGPGSYRDSVTVSAYPNNTGDIKLEANLEYRFKLVSVVEGALFVEAGNVWDMHRDDKRPGADFTFKRFYREIALDAGIGFRLDFTYFILSIDTGMKLIDPAGNRGWALKKLPGEDKLPRHILNLSFGIGYPF